MKRRLDIFFMFIFFMPSNADENVTGPPWEAALLSYERSLDGRSLIKQASGCIGDANLYKVHTVQRNKIPHL